MTLRYSWLPGSAAESLLLLLTASREKARTSAALPVSSNSSLSLM
ncbi:MAG: hypothetical protein ABSD02_20870 [Steroidobacteraceae bacterium]